MKRIWNDFVIGRRHHGAVALLRPHSVALLNQNVRKAPVARLQVDEQLHAHDALHNGVQRDDELLALHQRDEALTSSAAPRVAQDDGLGWGTDSDDLKLPGLAKNSVLYFLFWIGRSSGGTVF